MKNQDLHLRISKSEYELIKRVATQKDMTVSHFILSVIIPLCCKAESQDKDGAK